MQVPLGTLSMFGDAVSVTCWCSTVVRSALQQSQLHSLQVNSY